MDQNQKRRATAAALRAKELRDQKVLLTQERGNTERMREELDAAFKRDADRLAALAQKDEALRLANEKVAEARAERDRLVRIVDQFTSIGIVQLGANSPLSLRKT